MALEVNNELLANQMRVLQAASVVDSELGKRLREVIAAEMKAARDSVVASIKFKNGDPRGAAHSVRRVIYKKILGGNINILNRRTAGSPSNYEAPRKVYPGIGGQRGGNRRLRSQRTEDILHYGPVDRGFILRMVNSGTNPRYANGRNVSGGNRNLRNFFKLQEEGDYYRGSIAARNFFGTNGSREMDKALSNLSEIIEQEFNKLFTE
jgi:hypothetical protein